MEEVRNAAIVLQQTPSKQSSAVAHERLFGTQQAQTHAQPTKVGGRPFSPEDPVVRTMLKWCLDHGLKITAVHQTINCSTKIFTWFVNKVTEKRRKGDQNPEQELLAKMFQLLCNSSYGKMIKTLKRQTTVNSTTSESALRKDLQLVWFQNLEEIGNVYEIEKRKCQWKLTGLFKLGSGSTRWPSSGSCRPITIFGQVCT